MHDVIALPQHDLIDRVVGLDAGDHVRGVRRQRAAVTAAIQACHEALFDAPAGDPPSQTERLLLALLACRLTPAPALAAHYAARLRACHADSGLLELVTQAQAHLPATDRRDPVPLPAVLALGRALIQHQREPAATARSLLPASIAAMTTQLVGFVWFQTRLVAGLQAMRHADLASDFVPLALGDRPRLVATGAGAARPAQPPGTPAWDALRRLIREEAQAAPAPAGDAAQAANDRFTLRLRHTPDHLGADDIHALQHDDLTDVQILDLVHGTALGGWTRRLRLLAGQPT